MNFSELAKASTLIDPIMFADYRYPFYSNNNIQQLFAIMNYELQRIVQWCNAYKLPLNIEKTKYTFFRKPTTRHDIPLRYTASVNQRKSN